MRRLAFGVPFVIVVIAGVAALVLATIVHPAQARASHRQLDTLHAAAQQLAPRIAAMAAVTPATDCHGDGLTGCEQLQKPVADATIGVAAAMQTVTGQAPEIQCTNTSSTRFDASGATTKVPVTYCTLIIRIGSHLLDVDIEPHVVRHVGPDGTSAVATYVD
jgi:hypothetical protein